MHTILLTRKDREQLEDNGRQQQQAREHGEYLDFVPVVKIRTSDGSCTWLLTEIYPDDCDLAFGLCDLGMGFPELGDVNLAELEKLRNNEELRVVREPHFKATKTLTCYADEAFEARQPSVYAGHG